MTIRKEIPASRGRAICVEDADYPDSPVMFTICDSARPDVRVPAAISRADAAALGSLLTALYGTQWTSDKLALTPVTLNAVQAEATRAHLLHGEHSMLGPGHAAAQRLSILAEEVGEHADEAAAYALAVLIACTGLTGKLGRLARVLNDAMPAGTEGDPGKVYTEAIQLSAMAATLAQAIGAPGGPS